MTGLMRIRRNNRAGLTLIELIVAFAILLILSSMALPVARVRVQREKERRLRDSLTEMRKAIDRYKDYADAGRLGQVEPDSHGYPESLEELVEGVTVTNSGAAGGGLGNQPGAQGANPMNQRSSGFGQRSRTTSSARGRSGFGSSSFGSRSSAGRASGGIGGTQASGGDAEGEQKVRFLRRIPVDPMTGSADWGLRAVQDPPDSMSWGGRNVFDVYSKSMETALDGTRYSEW
jgi:general secretion pathway protein G